MSRLKAKWIYKDVNTLEDNGGELRVKIVPAGAIESTSTGLDIKDLGISNDMLAGSIPSTKLDKTLSGIFILLNFLTFILLPFICNNNIIVNI